MNFISFILFKRKGDSGSVLIEDIRSNLIPILICILFLWSMGNASPIEVPVLKDLQRIDGVVEVKDYYKKGSYKGKMIYIAALGGEKKSLQCLAGSNSTLLTCPNIHKISNINGIAHAWYIKGTNTLVELHSSSGVLISREQMLPIYTERSDIGKITMVGAWIFLVIFLAGILSNFYFNRNGSEQ